MDDCDVWSLRAEENGERIGFSKLLPEMGSIFTPNVLYSKNAEGLGKGGESKRPLPPTVHCHSWPALSKRIDIFIFRCIQTRWNKWVMPCKTYIHSLGYIIYVLKQFFMSNGVTSHSFYALQCSVSCGQNMIGECGFKIQRCKISLYNSIGKNITYKKAFTMGLNCSRIKRLWSDQFTAIEAEHCSCTGANASQFTKCFKYL